MSTKTCLLHIEVTQVIVATQVILVITLVRAIQDIQVQEHRLILCLAIRHRAIQVQAVQVVDCRQLLKVTQIL